MADQIDAQVFYDAIPLEEQKKWSKVRFTVSSSGGFIVTFYHGKRFIECSTNAPLLEQPEFYAPLLAEDAAAAAQRDWGDGWDEV